MKSKFTATVLIIANTDYVATVAPQGLAFETYARINTMLGEKCVIYTHEVTQAKARYIRRNYRKIPARDMHDMENWLKS